MKKSVLIVCAVMLCCLLLGAVSESAASQPPDDSYAADGADVRRPSITINEIIIFVAVMFILFRSYRINRKSRARLHHSDYQPKRFTAPDEERDLNEIHVVNDYDKD